MPSLVPDYAKRIPAAICFLVSGVCCVAAAQTPQTQQAPAGGAPVQSQVGIAPGQTPANVAPGTPTLRVTAREVLLDVLVMDKAGQPVPGLKAADFTVSEEGEPQVIRRIDEHLPMPEADLNKLASAPELPPNTFSNFMPVRNTNASIVLLLDAMDSPIGAQMVMREQLISFLKHMQPGPPVAIFQLDTEMRLIQGFTSDPKLLLEAAESKRDMPSLAKPTAAPRSYGADAQYRRVLMDNLRSGMQMLGRYLSGFPGRKNLIWFTGRVPMTIFGAGFGNPFRDGLLVQGGQGDETEELTDVLTVSRVAVYPVDTRGLVVMASDIGAARGRGMMLPPTGFYNHGNMDEVAEQTGGKAYYNTNDFTRVIEDVIRTSSSYYTIAYATTNTKWNGELRRIKVTVDRPEVQVQHKYGYYAYSLDTREQNGIAAIERRREKEVIAQPPNTTPQESGQPPAEARNTDASADSFALGATVHHTSSGGFAAAMGLGAIPPTEIVFAARLQPDMNTEKLGKQSAMPPDNFLKPEWQHKPFRNYTIFYDADVHRVRFARTPDGVRHGSVELVAVVYAPDGEQVNSIENNLTIDLTPDRYRELLVSGLHTKAEIAIPKKGNFFLRLGVHDKTGDQVGALEISVDEIKLDLPAAGPQTP